VRNTAHLINDLNEIPYDQNLKLASFVITNTYTNIPTNKRLAIIDKACESNNIENSLRLDIIKLSKTITNQISFQFLDKTYLHTESLATGAPTSSISSEFYLQYLEKTEVYKLLLKHSIEGYFCYVDNILII
jgi:hypothetical protein